ncbi:MAG: general secretion pathway protein GspK [Gammaproteobacteria bacterium]
MLRTIHPCSRSSGIALVLVLWVTVILTVMAGSFSLDMRREIDLVRNSRERTEAGPLAEAGIYYAMLRLSETDAQRKWRSDGSVYQFLFAGARIRVSIHDEAGKFDLNTVPNTLLISLLEKVGLDPEVPAKLVDAIIDWRDADDFRSVNGAEKDDYEAAGLNYGPRNQPFQTVQELRLVLGITGEIYNKLEPMVTVYNTSGGIDPSASPPEVLRAMPGVNQEIIDTYLEQRVANATNNLPPPPFPVQIPNLQFSQANGSAYSVYSEALIPDGRRAVISAVMKKGNDPRNPFVFLDWKPRFPGKDSLFADTVVLIGQAGREEY